jgi:hypothetical protein
MRRIALIVPFELTDGWPAKTGVIDCLRLNPRHANVMGVCVDYMRMSTLVLLTHPEFPDCPAGAEPLRYDAEQMRTRFPYLFADTNPLLYRDFSHLRARLAMTRPASWRRRAEKHYDPARYRK